MHYLDLLNIPKESSDYKKIQTAMDRLIAEHIPHAKQTVPVNPDFKQGKAAGGGGIPGNRDAVMVQFRAAAVENKAVQQNVAAVENVNENQNVNQNVNQNQNENQRYYGEYKAKVQDPFDLVAYMSGATKLIPLSDKMLAQDTSQSYHAIFDSSIRVTDNYALSTNKNKGNDVVGKSKKPLHQIGVIRNAEGKFEFVIGATLDMVNIAKAAKERKGIPDGRDVWVVSPTGQLAAPSKSPFNEAEMMKNPAYRRGLVQVLFYSGKVNELKKPEWQRELQAWIKESDIVVQKTMQRYFETEALGGKLPPEYTDSGLSKIWDNNAPVERLKEEQPAAFPAAPPAAAQKAPSEKLKEEAPVLAESGAGRSPPKFGIGRNRSQSPEFAGSPPKEAASKETSAKEGQSVRPRETDRTSPPKPSNSPPPVPNPVASEAQPAPKVQALKQPLAAYVVINGIPLTYNTGLDAETGKLREMKITEGRTPDGKIVTLKNNWGIEADGTMREMKDPKEARERCGLIRKIRIGNELKLPNGTIGKLDMGL